jgi:hypothetical protein
MRLRPQDMNRSELVKQLAEAATKPIGATSGLEEAPETDRAAGTVQRPATELFVWFEDTSARAAEGRRGMAGLPESLLPFSGSMRVIDRHYAPDHFHLLSAVRIRCTSDVCELIAALYTAALAVGTVAWVGTGVQYCRTWDEMYPASTGRHLR